jgi:hypothetical protein
MSRLDMYERHRALHGVQPGPGYGRHTTLGFYQDVEPYVIAANPSLHALPHAHASSANPTLHASPHSHPNLAGNPILYTAARADIDAASPTWHAPAHPRHVKVTGNLTSHALPHTHVDPWVQLLMDCPPVAPVCPRPAPHFLSPGTLLHMLIPRILAGGPDQARGVHHSTPTVPPSGGSTKRYRHGLVQRSHSSASHRPKPTKGVNLQGEARGKLRPADSGYAVQRSQSALYNRGPEGDPEEVSLSGGTVLPSSGSVQFRLAGQQAVHCTGFGPCPAPDLTPNPMAELPIAQTPSPARLVKGFSFRPVDSSVSNCRIGRVDSFAQDGHDSSDLPPLLHTRSFTMGRTPHGPADADKCAEEGLGLRGHMDPCVMAGAPQPYPADVVSGAARGHMGGACPAALSHGVESRGALWGLAGWPRPRKNLAGFGVAPQPNPPETLPLVRGVPSLPQAPRPALEGPGHNNRPDAPNAPADSKETGLACEKREDAGAPLAGSQKTKFVRKRRGDARLEPANPGKAHGGRKMSAYARQIAARSVRPRRRVSGRVPLLRLIRQPIRHRGKPLGSVNYRG